MEPDEIRPWERQPGETSKAYAAFSVYRDLGGERTLEKAAKELGKSTGTIDRWAAQWGWKARTEAWDSMPVRKAEEAYTEMTKRIADQHSRIATKLLAKLETNVDLLPEGADPSMRFSTALGAARQSHQFATDLSKPQDQAKTAITEAIENLISKLAGEE